ncbi:PAS domain S-box/diguanylate cyclase (GGDEF) domain-containing protein [Desulfocapsa sulfexigens DSM 10523]|uniref:PAS domain S-box/diguanylate cyclase (GGDEF) domain-containing protein n=1 Tax=Desulfocapsa sulfexigens (strain DSM 10523 / SB164P1) TaxID=1167006 RepID=M1NJL9_DESSD|nr:EAL domain-containing protein [Desulfocapsa sulfexigens]AGF79774.1 PAS domain S-box/diguanylate cyclase (GGDEF) domain-containing protein [Desulfocapsa sulfexigens DSM 10523]
MSSQSSSIFDKSTSLHGEELLRTLLNAMPDIVCFKDGNGRWLEANKADLELFQLLGIDYVGKKDSELAQFSPFYKGAFLSCEASDEESWKAGKPTQSEEIIPLPGGGSTILDIHKIPLFHENGNRKGLVVLGRDITSQKKAEEELKQRRWQESAINKLLRIGFRNVSLKEQLSEALDIIVKLPWLHFLPRGGIFLIDKKEPESLVLFVQKDMDVSLLKHCQTIRFGECLCGIAAQKREIICTRGLPGKDQYRLGTSEKRHHYIIPIVHLEKVLGVLMLYVEVAHVCEDRHLNFMQVVAGTLALLIERQEAEDSLLTSKANLTKAQEIARLGYWEWFIPENNLFFSDGVYRILERESNQGVVSYNVFLKFVHPDDRQRVQDAVTHVLDTGEPFNIYYRVVTRHRHYLEVRVEGEIEYDTNGLPLRMFGTVQDVTLHRERKKQLALAARVFESSIEGITITDASGIIQSVNQAFTHITGYSREEAVGNKPSILKSDRHDQAFYQAMWSILNDTGRWEGEIWNRRKNGEIYPEYLIITAITDEYDRVTNYVAVFHDLTEIRSYEDQIHFQAYHDALTSLPNRFLMLDRLRVAIGHAQQSSHNVVVLCLDLDNFKHINDSLGHMAGDFLLQQVAERLKACVEDDTTVARLGGDDFAILLEQCEDLKDVVVTAEKILDQFTTSFNLTSYETFITASIGITSFPGDGRDAETLLKNGELAMYRAKIEGKNRYQFFTKGMNSKVIHRLSLENRLRVALDREEFLVYYQPKVSIGSGEILGMEALIRWQTTDGQVISPLDFVPLAEETGLIVPIGEYVLRKACVDTGKWLEKNKKLSVSVNLSARQFMEKDLVGTLVAIVHEVGLPVAHLELEITESVVMGNEQTAIKQLLEFKEAGIRLALDDFGTGYSSLQYLRMMPIDTLKIDRSFIKDIPDNKDSSSIATTIISLAQALNLELVAEGVENRAQLEFLSLQNSKDMQIQGYLFSPPLPDAAFSELLNLNCPYDVVVSSPGRE